LFGLWYLFNIYFNIYNKQVLVHSWDLYFLTSIFIIVFLLIFIFSIYDACLCCDKLYLEMLKNMLNLNVDFELDVMLFLCRFWRRVISL
jgi:hypothetical protein